uniref:Vpr protein n=1 Tax=Simian immunodeficiency virus TaxID=11723 RepID=Q70IH1_SIV|nr:vpr protein [Simian immunodeficiency virus]
MERLPPSHPPALVSRMAETTQRQLQEAVWDITEEARKHFSKEEITGIWDHCWSLPALPHWTEGQVMAAAVIDFIRIMQKEIWKHYRVGCFHREAERVRHYPNIRPLRPRREEP